MSSPASRTRGVFSVPEASAEQHHYFSRAASKLGPTRYTAGDVQHLQALSKTWESNWLLRRDKGELFEPYFLQWRPLASWDNHIGLL